jgi:hypothetical protein
MLIVKMEFFLPCFDLSLPGGGGHVMHVPYRAWGVIGHDIGGKVIPAKMVRLAESQLLE